MFFLAEYAAMFILALLVAAVFLGGGAWPFGEELGPLGQLVLTAAKAGLVIFTIFWVRATVPRLRIDQLMNFSWKVLLPLAFAQILVNGLILVYDLPNATTNVLLAVTSGAGVLFVGWVINRNINRPRPRPVLLNRSAVAAAGAQSEAAR
jgi:NADH-quinone oxidoreductase subunit H